MEMNFFMPAKIITGRGCVEKNAAIFADFGKKCLIVTGKSSAEKCGALSDVKNALEAAGVEYRHFNGIGQNPTYDSCKQASLDAADFGAEFIIGIGGGSPLDAAKAVAVLATDKNMDTEKLYSMKWEKAPLPIIAVGTTAGTGSEVTPVSVITTPDGLKKSFRGDKLYPAVSFGDPQYTMSLPTNFTRSTALDALCHCVESYFNRTSNEINRNFALRGIKILIEMLEKTASCDALSLTYDDREKLYCASLYGGLAISVAGTTFPHAMGYFLSEQYEIPHGNACAVYLDAFLDYNIKEAPGEAEEFFALLGTTKNQLSDLVARNLPGGKNLGVSLTNDDIAALAPRFENNKNLKKCYGNADMTFAAELLEKLFG